MNDTPPLDSLVSAEATFKVAASRMEDGTASPDVVSRVEAIIVTATRQHTRWGKLTIDALRVLGQYLERNPYRGMGKGGRPPKTVRADSLPTLAERGVKDRRIAARALAVARIKEADWAAYIASGRTSERGLHEFVKDRGLIWDENYSETETGNVVSLASAPDQHGRGRPWWFPSAHGKKYLALQATAASEEWYTPPEVFRALNCRFDLDVASPGADQVPWIPADRHFTLADNGLEQDWGDDFVFMNAPYGRGKSPPWLEKFRKHGNGVCLVVDRTSTKWWQELCGNADLILQVNKKIDFVRPDSDGDDTGTNALGSSLVAYGERGVQALMNAAAAGLGTLFKPCQSFLTSHWLKFRPGVDVQDVRARFRAIDWSDPKYIETTERYVRGYRSLSMNAVVDEYERREPQAPPDDPDTRYIHYDDPYHSFGGGVRICKYPQTARFVANVQVPLDFDLAAHLRARFAPETDR